MADRTITKVLGRKLTAENSVVEILVETADGSRVAMNIVCEAVGDLVMSLMSAASRAALLEDDGMPIEASEDRAVIHHLFPIEKMYVVRQPNPAVCHVKMMTRDGALFEFLVPSSEIFQQTTRQSE